MWLDALSLPGAGRSWRVTQTLRWTLVARLGTFVLRWRSRPTIVRTPRLSAEWLRRHEIESAKHRTDR